MRSKLFFSLSVLLAAWLVSTRAMAQEGTEAQELNSHPELNLSDDKMLIMDGDSKAAKTSQSRDTNTTMNAASTPNNSKKQEQQKPSSSNPTNDKTQEDPLSFNFLYFIIQKFKFSDIVDD
jgi:hypothetical protein